MIGHDFGVMLASPSKNIHPDVETAVGLMFDTDAWWAEIKYDGIRCLAFMEDGRVTLMNRAGRDITFRYPEIEEALAKLYPRNTYVFDGEIVCLRNGEPSFALVHERDAQQNAKRIPALIQSQPATLVTFDILHNRGSDLLGMPHVARRLMLKTEAERRWTTDQLDWSRSVQGVDAIALWQRVKDRGWEGMIAKSSMGHYRPGRSRDWVKLKKTYMVSVIAGGYTAGKGARAGSFGAIQMFCLDDAGQPVHVGDVGTGNWRGDEISDIKALIDKGDVLILEVEILNFSKAGVCRMPSFKYVRSDATVLDCTMSQFDAVPIT